MQLVRCDQAVATGAQSVVKVVWCFQHWLTTGVWSDVSCWLLSTGAGRGRGRGGMPGMGMGPGGPMAPGGPYGMRPGMMPAMGGKDHRLLFLSNGFHQYGVCSL